MLKICLENNRGRIIGSIPRELQSAITEALSYEKPNYWFTKSYKNNQWDGVVSYFQLGTQSFQVGFADIITSLFDEYEVPYEVIDNRKHFYIAEAGINEACVLGCDTNGSIRLRDYQEVVLRDAIKAMRGIIKIATGGGKTAVAIALTKAIGRKTLFVVPGIDLMNQTVKKYNERLPDWSVGRIGDGILETGCDITVAVVNSLVTIKETEKGNSSIKKNDVLRELECKVDVMHTDECHHLSSKLFKAITRTSKIPYRFGLSATPFDRTDGDCLYLMGVTGSLICDISITDLVEQGILAKPIVHITRIHEPEYIGKANYGTVYKKCIVENEHRNSLIIEDVKKEAPNPILILVERIEHGKTLVGAIQDAGIPAVFLHGTISGEERKQTLEEFKAGKYTVLVGTSIMKQGIDIPIINAVILAGGGESRIALLQKIGRGMRLNDSGDTFRVYDYADLTHKYLAKHSLARLREYQKEKAIEVIEEERIVG